MKHDHHVTDTDDLTEPEPEPAAAGVPPGRPPIAVGTSGRDEGEDRPPPIPLGLPIMESDLPRDVVEVFRKAGIITFGDLLADGRDLSAFRLSLVDRRRVRRWLDHLQREAGR